MLRTGKHLSIRLILAALAIAGCERTTPTELEARASATATRHPILFVHGWQGNARSGT
ncbi:MAG TPA: hypothetical protein VGR37_01180 [Longimicrobiaceae bacterium]|nr:hypothetical protein [Longimicrobiaceae bacterium]